MAIISIPFFILAALASQSSAQSSNSATVWGSVALVMNGERTPLEGGMPTLTPQGAQQMLRQGEAFRARYLTGDGSNNGQSPSSSRTVIENISRNAINNTQLSMLSSTDKYITAGAVAFMQGLYPPDEEALLDTDGGRELGHDTTTDNATDYPLQGYQYPAIDTLSTYELASLPLQGHVGCNKWYFSMNHLWADPAIADFQESLNNSYDLLFSEPPLRGTLPKDNISFNRAYQIYDWVRYQYAHNQTVYDGLQEGPFSEPSMDFLARNALQQQLALHADNSVSKAQHDDPIRTIAGRTLAQGVLDALQSNINNQGTTNKLTVMFSSFQPFISFFALSRLNHAELDSSSAFASLPEPGAAMIFELIGDETDQPGVFPSNENLWVRFVYRRDTNDSSPFRADHLFSRSRGEFRLPLSYFQDEMRKLALDVGSWCEECDSSQSFCLASQGVPIDSPTFDDSVRKAAQSPVLAGIIGAVIMLAIVGFAIAAAAFFGGVRLYRNRGGGDRSSGRGLGGFKGAEKMASDADLAIVKGGARHERVGSWELGGGSQGPPPIIVNQTGDSPAADVDADAEPRNGGLGAGLSVGRASGEARGKNAVNDDGVSITSVDISATPVKPRESV